MNVIEVENLRKTYGGLLSPRVQALCGVDLSVESGQAFGLLGPNGAGKTTLVKILLGLVHASAGHARLLGRPPADPASRLLVGYMPERREYPPFLTAAQVLDFFGRMLGLDVAERRARTARVLEEVELSRWRDHRVGGFSKGMQQRLALAQALLPEPQVLFLDEPTEGIDPLGRVAIRRILRRNLERGRALFVNSHMLTEVEMVCDRVAILVRGRVVREGPLASLTSPQAQYRLTLANADGDAVAALLAGSGVTAEALEAPPGSSLWRLSVTDRAALNAALDRVRSAGIEVEELRRVRATLEEVFVETIRAESEPHPADGPAAAPPGSAAAVAEARR